MDIEPYGSIMSLLEICKNFIPKYDGLNHAHFLYALSDKKGMKPYKKKEMADYFSKIYIPSLDVQLGIKNPSRKKHRFIKTLDDFYKSKDFSFNIFELKRNCIKRPQRLNEKLKALIDIKWIERKGKPKHYIYYSTDKFLRFIKKTEINGIIRRLNFEEIEKVYDFIFNIVYSKNSKKTKGAINNKLFIRQYVYNTYEQKKTNSFNQ